MKTYTIGLFVVALLLGLVSACVPGVSAGQNFPEVVQTPIIATDITVVQPTVIVTETLAPTKTSAPQLTQTPTSILEPTSTRVPWLSSTREPDTPIEYLVLPELVLTDLGIVDKYYNTDSGNIWKIVFKEEYGILIVEKVGVQEQDLTWNIYVEGSENKYQVVSSRPAIVRFTLIGANDESEPEKVKTENGWAYVGGGLRYTDFYPYAWNWVGFDSPDIARISETAYDVILKRLYLRVNFKTGDISIDPDAFGPSKDKNWCNKLAKESPILTLYGMENYFVDSRKYCPLLSIKKIE